MLILARQSPYSAGIDSRRQNLTSKVDPRTIRVNPLVSMIYTKLFQRC